MNFVALRMLTGDRAKYFGLVFAIAFCTFLLENQTTIFANILQRTASQILDVTDAEVWVMDPQTEYWEQTKALKDTDLTRVRGVPGVQWAVRLFKGNPIARTLDGKFAAAFLVGLDDATLAGAPRRMLLGSWERLREPDSVVLDQAGYILLFPNQPLALDRTLEMNDHRVTIVGISDASPPVREPAGHAHPIQRSHQLPRTRAHPALVRGRESGDRGDATRAGGADSRAHGSSCPHDAGVHVGLHQVLPAEHRHPGELWHHDRGGARRRRRGRRPDVLLVHDREPEAVRRA